MPISSRSFCFTMPLIAKKWASRSMAIFSLHGTAGKGKALCLVHDYEVHNDYKRINKYYQGVVS